MSKTIETTINRSTLTAANTPLVEAINLHNISTTASDLSAKFSRQHIYSLLEMTGCAGVRIYPAANHNELVMIAVGVDGDDNDMKDSNHSCYIANANESNLFSINGLSDAIEGIGSSTDTIQTLENIQRSRNYMERLKVIFKDSFFTGKPFDEMLFEVVDLTFQNETEPDKTITAQRIGGVNAGELVASLLPCPPNCGGAYSSDSLLSIIKV